MDNCELLSKYLVIMTTEKSSLSSNKYYCYKCHYSCLYSSEYERHLSTAKHKKQHLTTVEQQKKLECICGKEYNTRSGLFKHKQKCNYKTPEQIKELSMWRTLDPSIKKDNGIGHYGRTRSYSI